MSVDGLPQVPATAIPASVRTRSDREAHRAALGFEQVLLGELVQELTPSSEGPYGGAVQDAFAGGLVAAGGIGLAAQLYPSLRKDSA
jgi:hypothetical protein